MRPHKDLPAGSQKWAEDVDKMEQRIKDLEALVKRLSEMLRVDPTRPDLNVNPQGIAPAANSADKQKLSGLADTDTYNVADKQVLGFDQKGQAWTPMDVPVWEPATDEDTLWGNLTADTQWVTKDPAHVLRTRTESGAGREGFGIVGTSDSAAWLMGAQRNLDTPSRAHGFVSAQPYYCSMGVQWFDYTSGSNWEVWGSITVDRDNVFLNTPRGSYDSSTRDGSVLVRSNWFYAPQVNGLAYPPRPTPAAGSSAPAGAQGYDMTLKKPIWWDGAQWTDALGTAV